MQCRHCFHIVMRWHRDEESLVLFGASLVFQSVRLRLVFESFSQDILGITDRTSLAAFRKFHADKGIESHAAGAEEKGSR